MHKIWRSQWAWSAICGEWEHGKCQELMTSKRAQHLNPQGVGNGSWFSQDQWECVYFQIFWKSRNSCSYTSECWLYWLPWVWVIKTMSLTVKKAKFQSQYYQVWLWLQSVLQRSGWFSKPTDHESAPTSNFRFLDIVLTAHFSQPRMNGPLSGKS